MRRALTALTLTLMLAGFIHGTAYAADTACSTVKIEILQELTLERIAFDAKLKVTNGMADKSLDNLRVDIIIRDDLGNEKNDLFFVKPPVCTGMSDVSGTGSVVGGTVGEAHWLIVPSPGAGGEDPAGVRYWVGATMSYDVNDVKEVVPITAVSITVKPEALLYLDYFTPYQVLGDNPFTAKTEPPVPYPLAVRVINDGNGTARNLKIKSAQPKIVENLQNLLIDFRILGSAVNDQPVETTLTPSFGDIPSKHSGTAYWEMISTLSGKIVEFDVTFTHDSELGGELTSLLKETNAHYLVHMVKNTMPGRDGRLDFLAASDATAGEVIPAYMLESEIPPGGEVRTASRSDVTVAGVVSEPARPTADDPDVDMGIDPSPSEWVYASTADPAKGLLRLYSVVRGDGYILDPNNFWIQEYLDANYQQRFKVCVFDYRPAGVSPVYTLVYEKPVDDSDAPETKLVYDGPAISPEDPAATVYVTPDTRIVFTASDNEGGSGVDSMFKKLSGTDTDFVDAFPINIADQGDYTLEYYSTDRSGNTEDVKTALIHVDDTVPAISSFVVAPESLSPGAPDGIVATTETEFVLTADDDSPSLDVTFEVLDAYGDVLASIDAEAAPGESTSVVWDGMGTDGNPLPAGTYTVRATVTDGLLDDAGDAVHVSQSDSAVNISEWFAGEPVDPNPDYAQMHPSISGTRVAWQDNRDGEWRIYARDVSGPAGSAQISPSGVESQWPYMDGDTVLWQGSAGGSWRIYAHDMNTGETTELPSDPEGAYPARNEEYPSAGAGWIAWQDDRKGNFDIYAYNMASGEVLAVTGHERDQVHPRVDAGVIYWEDYRHGPGEIYSFDLATRTERRMTVDPDEQTRPAAWGGVLVWTDHRNGNSDIYTLDKSTGEARLTFGSTDEAEPAVKEGSVIYTDYGKGLDDPELAFIDMISGTGGVLTNAAGHQDGPGMGEGYVVWQDDRDGVYQIYMAPFEVEPLPVMVRISPGYNLVAAGGTLADAYPSGTDLINGMRSEFGVDRVMVYDAYQGSASMVKDVSGAVTGTNFGITPGSGLVMYASGYGTLTVAASGETASYTLMPGMNQVGLLKVPYGYRAFDLLESIGLDNVGSVRSYDTTSGRWNTAAVRDKDGAKEVLGENFALRPGDGLIITMTKRVDGWNP